LLSGHGRYLPVLYLFTHPMVGGAIVLGHANPIRPRPIGPDTA
jgi:hypothetical protein